MNAADLEVVLRLAQAHLCDAPRIVTAEDFAAFERVVEAHAEAVLAL